jgi:hypothetical protein
MQSKEQAASKLGLAHQLRQRHAQRLRNDMHFEQGDVAVPTLHPTHVTAVKPCQQRKLLLNLKLDTGSWISLTAYDDPRSATGKRLVITPEGDTTNSITINNFDLTKAKTDEGYLGLKLKGTPLLALTSVDEAATLLGANNHFFGKNEGQTADLLGKTSSITEGLGKTFTFYLNQAAQAGDTITLALSGLADKFKAILGDRTVDADGAVITLVKGQNMVQVALVQEGDITADGNAQLSATYSGEAGSVTSNVWGIDIRDGGEIAQTKVGDQRAKLIGTETQQAVTPDQPSFGTYAWSETSWAADGLLTNGVVQADFSDVITGSTGNDTYVFSGQYGKDTVLETDGLGTIVLGGEYHDKAVGTGKANQWGVDLGAGQLAYHSFPLKTDPRLRRAHQGRLHCLREMNVIYKYSREAV